MIKKHTERHTETREVTDSYQCDICKKVFDCVYLGQGEVMTPERAKNLEETQEFAHIRTTGGYGSIFGDGSAIEIDMCQHCLKEKLGEWLRVGDSEMVRMMHDCGYDDEKKS